MMRISLLLFCFFISSIAFSQKAVSEEISGLLAAGSAIHEISLFNFVSEDIHDRSVQIEGLEKGTLLSLDEAAIEKLLTGNQDLIRLSLPFSERENVQLDLVQHQIFSEDFILTASDAPGMPLNYTHGLHYRGIISGDPNSLVALSIFNNEIMGLISTKDGNLVLGRLDSDRENRHIIYNDRDLTKAFAFDCSTMDDGKGYTIEELQPQNTGRDVDDCVRVYIEIDDDIVTQKGGAEPATNYITGLFNQSIVLYNAESVNMMINEIYAWTSPSPYNGSSSGAMLNAFQDYTGEFNGNIGHLVSYKASGGIAVLDNMCSSNPDWRKCFSSIDASYQNVPTYSWSVMVITHEMGHVVGSKHTHACAWNGDNTAIDGCAGATEGNCPLPGNPPEGGTIMSYCHLTNVGINFNLGFGPQPGSVLRNRVNAPNNCLTSCGPPPPPPPPSYCASSGNNTNYEYIKKVVLEDISNNSGNNGGYADYTSLSTDLAPGATYTINLTPGFPGSAYSENWRVWIDYNGDLDWDDSGEKVGQGAGSSVMNFTFTVPTNAVSGTTRMRVSMKYGSYPSTCGSFTYGEVEDYSIVISGGGPSCSDGIQNQGEDDVDCGGPCPACPTCNDGIQNQGEEGIDCGGPCAPCETCFDGILNQGEEDVDCGGPCPACASCNDGIQNQGEEGIDCGGPCPDACPPPPPEDDVVLLAHYFESGWDGWIDGGSDATRVYSSNSFEGNYSIRLRDNSGKSSSMTSPWLSLSDATSVQMEFYFKSVDIENGEDVIFRYKDETGVWNTIDQMTKGVEFENDVFYVATLSIPNFEPTSQGKLRIQCDASDDSDNIYIDAVTITKTTGAPLIENGLTIKEAVDLSEPIWQLLENKVREKILVYPNPADDVLNIAYEGDIQAIRLMSVHGVEASISQQDKVQKHIDIHHLMPGMYFLWIQTENDWHTIRFSKL